MRIGSFDFQKDANKKGCRSSHTCLLLAFIFHFLRRIIKYVGHCVQFEDKHKCCLRMLQIFINSEGCFTDKNNEVKYQDAGIEVRVCMFCLL